MRQQSVIVQHIYRSRGLKFVSSPEISKHKASLAGVYLCVCVNVNKLYLNITSCCVLPVLGFVLHKYHA